MAILKRHKSSIFGLVDKLNQIGDEIDGQVVARTTALGDLSELTVSERENLVAAVNQVAATLGDVSDDTLKIAENLADLADVAAARQNLAVKTTQAFDDQLELVALGLGTNHTVADLLSRDALLGLTRDDRVFVQDAGDGKWAQYKPSEFDVETGLPTAWIKISHQDALDNVSSPSAIRDLYESHVDTNIYVDVDKEKVDLLSATKAVNLDDVHLMSELVGDLVGVSNDTLGASVDAIVAFIDGASSNGGLVPARETVTVVGNRITLSHAPANGVHSIDSFGTIRYTNQDGVSYDAPVQATGQPNEFTVLTGEDVWDAKEVVVQYYYYADMNNPSDGSPEEPDNGELDGGENPPAEEPEVDGDGFADQGELPEP